MNFSELEDVDHLIQDLFIPRRYDSIVVQVYGHQVWTAAHGLSKIQQLIFGQLQAREINVIQDVCFFQEFVYVLNKNATEALIMTAICESQGVVAEVEVLQARGVFTKLLCDVSHRLWRQFRM